ncbi:MAG: hypothetical protein AB1730_15775 [Myxococcota bacterium]
MTTHRATLAAATRSVSLKTGRKDLEALAKELVAKLPAPIATAEAPRSSRHPRSRRRTRTSRRR